MSICTFGPNIPDTCLQAPSWWTPLHIAWVAVAAVCVLALLAAAVDLIRSRHPRPRSDDPWRYAATFGDLCDLTARWIEGDIPEQPGYHGPSDIEDPAMVPVLATLNRAGFMTTGSQAGGEGAGEGGAWWQQRAAVEGFATPEMTTALILAADDAGLTIIVRDRTSLPRWRYRYDRSVTVTEVNGRHFTAFGVHVPRRHIRDDWLGYGRCHPGAVKALCDSWQVTLIDPEWGRADLLWETLEQAIAAKPGAGCPQWSATSMTTYVCDRCGLPQRSCTCQEGPKNPWPLRKAEAVMSTTRLQVVPVGLSGCYGIHDGHANRWVQVWTGQHARSTADEHMDRILRRLRRASARRPS
jgi:hypothetical protein